jgi:hypothetical protein
VTPDHIKVFANVDAAERRQAALLGGRKER